MLRCTSFFKPLLGCLSLVLVVIPSCSSSDATDLCGSLTGDAAGLHVTDCPRGIITLSEVAYDANGAKTSFAFVASCPGRSAHGIWSQAGGLECVEGTYPCEAGVCMPTSNADCAVLINCEELGECGYLDGKCVLTDAGCSHSQIPCGLSGACHLGSGGVCAATSDDDCRSPLLSCPDCGFKGACATSGNCYAENGACVARQDSDCKRAQQCAFAGKCSLAGSACAAVTDSDCRASEVCRTAGQCAAVGGTCQAP